MTWDWEYENDTLTHRFEVEGSAYVATLEYDEGSESPREWHGATQLRITGPSRHCDIDETTGREGDALDRFIELYGSDDADKVIRAYNLWARIADTDVTVHHVGGQGYTQGDWWEGFMLVDGNEIGDADPAVLAQRESDVYTAWRFGDIMIMRLYGPGEELVSESIILAGIHPSSRTIESCPDVDACAIEWAMSDHGKRHAGDRPRT